MHTVVVRGNGLERQFQLFTKQMATLVLGLLGRPTNLRYVSKH